MLLMITGLYPLGVSIYIITDQTHYEKSDWSRAFNQFTIACERDMINEGCPIHSTRVDSSLVFAIRQTGNRFVNPIPWNRHESFPLLSIRHARNRFARDLENIVDLDFEGGLKMLSIRVDSIESTRIVRIDARLKFVASF